MLKFGPSKNYHEEAQKILIHAFEIFDYKFLITPNKLHYV